MNLYNQHLDIEFKKLSKDQPFNIPLILNETSIFKVEVVRFPEDEEMDHLECALVNAQKVCQESIVWSVFYSELEEIEQEIRQEPGLEKKNEIAENTSFIKASGEETTTEKRDQTVVPTNEEFVPSKFLQIFKDRGAELFGYLQTEYTMDDHSPVAKYSYIYRFLDQEQLVTARSQSNYMEWIKETMGIPMSKVFCKTYKYDDTIHHLLSRLKSNFEKSKIGTKSELN